MLAHDPMSLIYTPVSPVQSEKAARPMLVTLSGMVILVRLLHEEKAESPILVTLSGITIFDKDLSLIKALLLISVTLPSPADSTMLVYCCPRGLKMLSQNWIGAVRVFRPIHPVNAVLSMLVTLSGI